MKLQEVLQLIAAQVHADPLELQGYAAEDSLGGHHVNPAYAEFPMGSIWQAEGKMLYALARWLKPDLIIEVGGLAGCGSSHLAAACKANGAGRVVSLDNGTLAGVHGSHIPNDLRPYVELIRANGEDWLMTQPEQSIGMIFEDATHETPLVALVSQIALRKLKPGGLLVNHDAAHDTFFDSNGEHYDSNQTGMKVRNGLAQAGALFNVYKAEPSDCGIALTVAPGEWVQSEPEDMVGTAETVEGWVASAGFAPMESDPPAKIKKPRKARAKKV